MRNTFLAVLAICLMAGGCVRTANPILKDNQVISNDALLGKWVSTDDGRMSAELRKGGDHRYKMNYVNEHGKKGDFIVRFGKIGDMTVAEVSADAFAADVSDEYKSLLIPMYNFVVIEKATPTQVQLTGIDFDWFGKYLKANPDELELLGSPGDEIVNSSTEDFQAFVLRHIKDPGMLGKPQTFVRPGDPTTRPAK